MPGCVWGGERTHTRTLVTGCCTGCEVSCHVGVLRDTPGPSPAPALRVDSRSRRQTPRTALCLVPERTRRVPPTDPKMRTVPRAANGAGGERGHEWGAGDGAPLCARQDPQIKGPDSSAPRSGDAPNPSPAARSPLDCATPAPGRRTGVSFACSGLWAPPRSKPYPVLSSGGCLSTAGPSRRPPHPPP